MTGLLMIWNYVRLVPFTLCSLGAVLLSLETSPCRAQDSSAVPAEKAFATVNQQVPVNWLYGAYLAKEVPWKPLSNEMRWKLYVRQSFTTPRHLHQDGVLCRVRHLQEFAAGMGTIGGGIGRRFGSFYAQYLIQNSFTSMGDALVEWEPRYDRCQCTGIWPRTKHAFIRNFITYNNEKKLRPQIFLYASAYGGGALSAMWQPNNPNIEVKGYQGAISQAWTGVVGHLIAEFAPDVERAVIRRHKQD